MKLRRDIIESCLSIDESAHKTYLNYAKISEVEVLRSFWKKMAEEEYSHIKYWQKLLALQSEGKLHNVFSQPEKTAAELKELSAKAKQVQRSSDESMSIEQMFYNAFELEFIMMYPDLEILFRLMKSQTNNISPDDNYSDHIEAFIGVAKTHIPSSHQTTLILNLLLRNWHNAKELAYQVEQVKTLRGILPVCSHCKKIRDEHNDWSSLETYIHEHTEAEMSHTICPECMSMHHPDVEE